MLEPKKRWQERNGDLKVCWETYEFAGNPCVGAGFLGSIAQRNKQRLGEPG